MDQTQRNWPKNLRICDLRQKKLRAHLWKSESFAQHCNDASEKATLVFFTSIGKLGLRETQLSVNAHFCTAHYCNFMQTVGYDDFDLL